jgi:hypothetical protein
MDSGAMNALFSKIGQGIAAYLSKPVRWRRRMIAFGSGDP